MVLVNSLISWLNYSFKALEKMHPRRLQIQSQSRINNLRWDFLEEEEKLRAIHALDSQDYLATSTLEINRLRRKILYGHCTSVEEIAQNEEKINNKLNKVLDKHRLMLREHHLREQVFRKGNWIKVYEAEIRCLEEESWDYPEEEKKYHSRIRYLNNQIKSFMRQIKDAEKSLDSLLDSD